MGGLKERSSQTAFGGIPGAGKLLGREFFEHSPELVAPRLLGKLLIHRDASGVMAGRIVEVEAYLGPHNHPPDPSAHSHRGPTPRNQVLFGLAGHAYVYSIYGRYFCLNVSCEAEGLAGCVLLRALEPVAGIEAMAVNRGLPKGVRQSERLIRQLASGPSRLCMALGVERLSHNGLDVTKPSSPLQIRDDGCEVAEALVTARIGIREAADWPLRFAIPGNPAVSGPKQLGGRRVPIR
jgi:DNA-3-methyladenine glycosylase